MFDVVAQAVRSTRTARGLSLDQLAARAGLSKGAVVAVESGSGNPNLATLVRLADALGVSVSALVDDSTRPVVRVVDAATIEPLWTGPAGGTARLVVTTAGPSPVEVWQWRLGAGERYDSHPHPAGIVETVTVVSGDAVVTVGAAAHRLGAGMTATFPADTDHGYTGDEPAGAHLLMTVHLLAASSQGPRR